MLKDILKNSPFFLEDQDIQWVEETISQMTLEEKIGQLFINLGYRHDEEYLLNVISKYHIGGVRYNPNNAKTIYNQNRILQENSKIPLLIAANLESGGNGACTDGTMVGHPVQIGATGNPKYARKMGYVGGVEGAAVGCNWSFSPIVDINYNFRNPVTMTRAYSNKPEEVLEMSKEYFEGITKSGIAAAMKHFPGDGVDSRDQHLVTTVNTMSPAEWDKTYGTIYRGMIEAGVQSVMVGHIMLPEYSKKLNPELEDKDLLPATLSPELVTGLLRNQLGFNGLVLTDASPMIGLTSAMKRSELLPKAIAAGCDMFLFFNDPDEDFEFMMEGYRNGTISEERLQEALYRILGLKASIGLHKKQKEGTLVPPESGLDVIGSEEHKVIAREVADRSITLAKQTRADLPLTPETHKRLKVFMIGEDIQFFGIKQDGVINIVKEELESAGFEVTIETGDQKVEQEAVGVKAVQKFNREKVSSLSKSFDAVLVFANVQQFAQQNHSLIKWSSPMGPDVPWYVTELPTVFVSLHNPYHLYDVPMIKTYINAYAPTRTIIKETIKKLTGSSEFRGESSVDVFCGLWDTKL